MRLAGGKIPNKTVFFAEFLDSGGLKKTHQISRSSKGQLSPPPVAFRTTARCKIEGRSGSRRSFPGRDFLVGG